MTQYLPLDPDSLDVTVLEEPVTILLCALARGTLVVTSPALPKPISLTWAGKTFDGAIGWSQEGGKLTLEMSRTTIHPNEDLYSMVRVTNQPGEVQLEDGGILRARWAHLVRRSATGLVDLSGWTWSSTGRRLWVGRLDHIRIENGNLRMALRNGKFFEGAIRLEGTYDWYVVENRDERSTSVVVDTKGTELDTDVLGDDFVALEFVLGRPLALAYLVAVDADHKAVGAVGLEFGGTSVASGRRTPVADFRDIGVNYPDPVEEDIWIPVLFSAVARKLREEGPDSPLLIAVAAYVESVSAGNIHVKYLLAQVALEAFCAHVVPAGGALVKDTGAWRAFVDQHQKEIGCLARDEKAASVLLNKLRHNVHQAPTSGRVLAALDHFGLEVPKGAQKEIGQRNTSAHKFVMAEESTADVQNLADRLATIQTLLVAVIAKYLDFRGPIIGWERMRGRHKIPDWWSWERLPEARRMYLVVESEDEHEPELAGATNANDRIRANH